MAELTSKIEIVFSEKLRDMLVLFVNALAIHTRVVGMKAFGSPHYYSEQAFFEVQQQLEEISEKLKEL